MVQLLGLDVWNVLKYQTWGFGGWVAKDIIQLDDVWTAVERLQYFGLTIDLFGADWLKNLDYTRLVVLGIHTLEYFGVFSATKLLLNLVGVHFGPGHVVLVVKRVVLGTLGTHLFVRAFKGLALHLIIS